MASGVDIRDVTLPIGVVRPMLIDNPGPAWLRLDGKTEYQRAMYPDFLTVTKGSSWVLAGSTSATFKLSKVPAGTALVASGFDTEAGRLVGSDSVTLLADHMPEHDHGYVDDTVEMTPGKAGLLAGLLPILTGGSPRGQSKTTGKAGKAKPTPVPIKPPGFVAHMFVFAGRPRG